MDKKTYKGVYKITCNKNGNFYIGESLDILNRWSEHIDDLKNNKKYVAFQRDFNTYGLSNFTFTILDENDKYTKQDILNIEARYILELKPKYNVQNPTININTGELIDTQRSRQISLENKFISELKNKIKSSKNKYFIKDIYCMYFEKENYTYEEYFNDLIKNKFISKNKIGNKIFYSTNKSKGFFNLLQNKNGNNYVFIYVDEEGLTELLQFFNLINISKQNS
jgi:group I intron endonuclease